MLAGKSEVTSAAALLQRARVLGACCGILIAAGCAPAPPRAAPDTPTVVTGLDALLRDGHPVLSGRRVGLITNHTGIDRDGATNEITAAWPAQLARFGAARQRYLLYP
jgi:hypothetical protein